MVVGDIGSAGAAVVPSNRLTKQIKSKEPPGEVRSILPWCIRRGY